VDAAQAQLDRMTLTAPFNGRVARINVAEGELVAGSTPVLTMADYSGWLVETTNLTELDVALVETGAPVSVRLDAIPDETLTGTVTEIGLVAGLSQGDVVYDVTIRLEPVTDLPVRWGMTAFVDIEVE